MPGVAPGMTSEMGWLCHCRSSSQCCPAWQVCTYTFPVDCISLLHAHILAVGEHAVSCIQCTCCLLCTSAAACKRLSLLLQPGTGPCPICGRLVMCRCKPRLMSAHATCAPRTTLHNGVGAPMLTTPPGNSPQPPPCWHSPPNASPMHWWPMHTPNKGKSGPSSRTA